MLDWSQINISVWTYFFFLNRALFNFLFIYFYFYFLAVLGLHFCARAFSSCGKWGPLFIAVHGPLTIVAPLVAEHRLQTRRLSNCGSWAQLLHGMWDLPRPGLEPVSPALAGRFSTTAPPGKPYSIFNCFQAKSKNPYLDSQGSMYLSCLFSFIHYLSCSVFSMHTYLSASLVNYGSLYLRAFLRLVSFA